ncbi:zinc finger protein 91-like [Oppia nitens]|uniref:zinc finger protein 91-like n=1 Tax=Oppia nitens TaxID=1686743 RepID=UPI0023DBE31C|nr:zinc finger protein 91-like [Oppia nitens]
MDDLKRENQRLASELAKYQAECRQMWSLRQSMHRVVSFASKLQSDCRCPQFEQFRQFGGQLIAEYNKIKSFNQNTGTLPMIGSQQMVNKDRPTKTTATAAAVANKSAVQLAADKSPPVMMKTKSSTNKKTTVITIVDDEDDNDSQEVIVDGVVDIDNNVVVVGVDSNQPYPEVNIYLCGKGGCRERFAAVEPLHQHLTDVHKVETDFAELRQRLTVGYYIKTMKSLSTKKASTLIKNSLTTKAVTTKTMTTPAETNLTAGQPLTIMTKDGKQLTIPSSLYSNNNNNGNTGTILLVPTSTTTTTPSNTGNHCIHCNKSFDSSDQLTDHFKTIHKTDTVMNNFYRIPVGSASGGEAHLMVPITANTTSTVAPAVASVPIVAYRSFKVSAFNQFICRHCSYRCKGCGTHRNKFSDATLAAFMREHLDRQHPNYRSSFDKVLEAKARNQSLMMECLQCNELLDGTKLSFIQHHGLCHSAANSAAYSLCCDSCTYTTQSYELLVKHIHLYHYEVCLSDGNKVIVGSTGIVTVEQQQQSDANNNNNTTAADANETITGNEQQVTTTTTNDELLEHQLIETAQQQQQQEPPAAAPLAAAVGKVWTAPKRYACSQPKCQKQFRQAILLLKHVRNTHKIIECDKCGGESFKSVQLLNAHLLKCHREYLIRCNSCDYYTFWPEFHDRHIRNNHTIPWSVCPYKDCGQRRRTAGGMEKHINTVHKHQHRPHRCPECDQRFFSGQQLTSHLAKQHRQSVYKCQDCGYSSSNKTVVDRHREQKHTDTDRIYKCNADGCTFETRLRNGLQRHKMRWHSQRHVCTFRQCGRVFTVNAELQRHSLKHPFPHVCDQPNCDRDFQWKTLLDRHQYVVHNVIPRKRKRKGRCKPAAAVDGVSDTPTTTKFTIGITK